LQHGSHWAVIAKEAVFEGRRKSTDLRDRFRNAFPELYEQAGYKPRQKGPKKDRRPSQSVAHAPVAREALAPLSSGGSSSAAGTGTNWMHGISAALAGVAATDDAAAPARPPPFSAPSDTSVSAHSQCTSGEVSHSETSDGEFSDAVPWERPARQAAPPTQLQRESAGRRQGSQGAPLVSPREELQQQQLQQQAQQQEQASALDFLRETHTESAGGASAGAPSTAQASGASHGSLGRSSSLHKGEHVLRRTQSSKRANPKISSFDCPPASTLQHQQRTHTFHHQQRLSKQHGTTPPAARSVSRDRSTAALLAAQQDAALGAEGAPSRPQLDRSQTADVATGMPWQASPDDAFAAMDLDQLSQLGQMISEPSASQLLDSRAAASQDLLASMDSRDVMDVDYEAAAPTAERSYAPAGRTDGTPARDSFAARSAQPDLSSLLSGSPFDFASGSGSARPLAVASFQDLLDPVGPPQSPSTWGASFTPVSSGAYTSDTSAAGVASMTEHNHWAGDLLHRGGAADGMQQPPPSFVSLANMQLPGERSLSADWSQAKRTSADGAALDANFAPGQAQRSSSVSASSERSLSSTPSVHELVNRSALLGSASERGASDMRPELTARETAERIAMQDAHISMMATAYRQPYSYPADDLHLTSLGSQTLFPSLVENTSAHRRRRSTDTLRQNFSAAEMAVAFEPTPPLSQVQQQWSAAAGSDPSRTGHYGGVAAFGEASSPRSSARERGHGRLSAFDVAAAFAHSGLANEAFGGSSEHIASGDPASYAESLPDLPQTGSYADLGSFASSGGAPMLQTSYDDLDLHAFLARSLGAAAPAPFSPRAFALSLESGGAWSGAAGAGASGADAGRSTGASGAAFADVRPPLPPKAWSDYGGEALLAGSTNPAGVAPSQPQSAAAARLETTSLLELDAAARWPSAASAAGGAFDRLEHLYLEGMHTPPSPAAAHLRAAATGFSHAAGTSWSAPWAASSPRLWAAETGEAAASRDSAGRGRPSHSGGGV
jgi:hypothetical protein